MVSFGSIWEAIKKEVKVSIIEPFKAGLPTSYKQLGGDILTVATLGTMGGLQAGVKLPAISKVVTPVVSKAATFIVEKPVKAVLVSGVIAGGGLQLVKPAFEKIKEVTETAVPVLLGEEELTPETFKDVAKVLGIVAGVGVVGAVVGAVGKKVFEKFKAADEQLITEKPVGIGGEIPILPETTKIVTGEKPRARRRAKKTPSVRQYVKVNIINRATSTGMKITNKRYLNQELLIK